MITQDFVKRVIFADLSADAKVVWLATILLAEDNRRVANEQVALTVGFSRYRHKKALNELLAAKIIKGRADQ